MALNTQTNPNVLAAGNQIYSSKFITELQGRLLPLTGFTLDFSDDFNKAGDTVNVAYLESGTPGDYNRSSNNFETPTTESLKNIAVKLGAHKIIKWTITPEMLGSFDPVYWQGKAARDAHKLAKQIMLDVIGVASSNKVQNTHALTGTMDFNTVIDIANIADGLDLPADMASLYLTPVDFTNLLKSMNYNLTGSTVITQGDLGGIDFGFGAIHKLPASATTSFVALPQLCAIAARAYKGANFGRVGGSKMVEETIIEPNSKLTAVHTVVELTATKDVVNNIDILYGAEIADKKAGILLTRSSSGSDSE